MAASMVTGPAPGPVNIAALLTAVERAAPGEAVSVLLPILRRDLGALDVWFLITDHASEYLARFTRPYGEDAIEQVPISGTVPGEVLRVQRPRLDVSSARTSMYAPVTARGEAIGVLQVNFPAGIGDATDRLGQVSAVAHALAYIVITNRRYTDLFEWGQRSVPLGLAAEIQRRLMPESFTCEAAQATIAAWLEPAATVAGDTFDYSFDRSAVHISLTDAMGHQLAAAMLATVLVNSLRNSRRRHLDVAEQAVRANEALAAHAEADQFVTGLLLHIDLITGATKVINAGHVPFYFQRGDIVEAVTLPADLPFGMFEQTRYTVHHLSLRPHDRLLLVTDGMLERNATQVDIPASLTAMRDLHPREVVQDLTRQVVTTTGGLLEDDATVLCLDWYGQHRTERHVASGADPALASAPLGGGQGGLRRGVRRRGHASGGQMPRPERPDWT
jgi:hypothetical protein